MAKTKKELILDGLSCANCASKIEEAIQSLEGISSVNVNFTTKTLKVELEDTEVEEVLRKVKEVVNKIESHVVIKEKTLKKNDKKVVLLVGLDCANCASKIEDKIKLLPGVKSAVVDFIGKKLTLEIEDRKNSVAIINEVQEIVTELEPHVKVIVEGEEHKDEGHGHEHDHGEIASKKELRKIIIGGVLFFLPFIIGMPDILRFSFYFAAYVIVGGRVLLRAGKNILRGQIFDENFLMSIATVGAFAIGEFPEGVAVMLFYNVGEYVQSIAINRSRKSISSLMDIRPDYANLKINGELKTVDPEDVGVGDLIVVKPGEKVPLDGKVIEGSSLVDTSALTGESVLRDVEVGSDILSGFINNTGLLTVEVTKDFGESTVSKILDLVQNASGRKAPTENFITKFAKYYTPVVVAIAALLAVIPPLLIEDATFSQWIYRALVFLVISCPCALVISIPLGFFGGIGGASKRGILVKGSNFLEALNDVEIVVFDKTGTLTKGIFTVTQIQETAEIPSEKIIEYAALAESYSTHPIAKSILKSYGKDVDQSLLKDYKEIAGHGISVKVDGIALLVGNRKLMETEKIKYKDVKATGTVVHVAVDKNHIGYIVIADQIKDDSKDAIVGLKSIGIKKTIMLTGDNNAIASEISTHLGLDKYYAELLPHEKVERLEEINQGKSRKGKMIFVGDGINDAPVLARADVGVAMGGLGSDAAIEAADIVIMNDEPSKLVTAIKIAKRTRKIVWQNIVFAIGVKLIVLALGTVGLASIWEAVFADVGVTVIAVFNAMRVLNVKEI
ncbi:cadmium-translocating P-type ATPase [Alkalicella caledoniensis]|uniref:Cadmium-translocating P-type ATPase n=1 Tax=Alkalicella caledoniensis TaxID=2731377 RepID=A0A7G9W7H2_ALKCA|nr:heavy metal translocating P-type ATPase [Alkalicella caledoniensis]QNO14634.1 cadmium-translocating P-type ATPase [Alkalicella caledoniensis]